MSGDLDQLRVRRPEAFDLSRLRPDLKAALPHLTEATLRAAFRQEKAADALMKGISNLGLKVTRTPGELAWLLITRALMRAANRAALPLLLADWDGPESAWDEALAALGAALIEAQDRILQQQEYHLSPALLDHPRGVPGLDAAGKALAQWLIDAQHIDPEAARKAVVRLPELFVYAMCDEWVGKGSEYRPVDDALDATLSGAVRREWSWSRYRAHLAAEYQRPLFGTETFGVTLRLPDVYVPLRAHYVTRDRFGPVRRGCEEETRETRHVAWLEETLDEWLADAGASPVRVLAGGPGAGKSSFLKHYAAKIAEMRTRPVVLVELHLADVDGDLPGLVRGYVEESGLLGHNPLDRETGEPDLLVILDGLDELERSGRSGEQAARGVLKEVRECTELRRKGERDLRVLLSGREVLVSALRDEFRQPEQVLQLLPYGRPDLRDARDPKGLIQLDQREEWWSRFRRRTGRSDSPPWALDEITSEPLLNYLVALAQASGKLPQGKDVNVNQVYEALVSDVWERPWGDYQRPKPAEADFFAVLEEVAVATWHGDGKGATVAAIRTRCEKANLGHVLNALQQGAEAGVLSLLVAFFFRARGGSGEQDRTFEFTHKSFGEYLLARCLVFAVDEILVQRQKHTPTVARSRDGWSVPDALLHWATLCGRTLPTENAAEFFYREVAQHGTEWAGAHQQALVELVNAVVANGMPMEALPLPFAEMLRQARNAEASLLMALSACAQAAGRVSPVDWPDRFTMICWLWAFDAARSPCGLVRSYGLRGLQLDDAVLCDANLAGARLDGASLNGADLEGANLNGACLNYASLHRARLHSANLYCASLFYARLDRASLGGARLDSTNFGGAIYDDRTFWPAGFDPGKAGAVRRHDAS